MLHSLWPQIYEYAPPPPIFNAGYTTEVYIYLLCYVKFLMQSEICIV